MSLSEMSYHRRRLQVGERQRHAENLTAGLDPMAPAEPRGIGAHIFAALAARGGAQSEPGQRTDPRRRPSRPADDDDDQRRQMVQLRKATHPAPTHQADS